MRPGSGDSPVVPVGTGTTRLCENHANRPATRRLVDPPCRRSNVPKRLPVQGLDAARGRQEQAVAAPTGL